MEDGGSSQHQGFSEKRQVQARDDKPAAEDVVSMGDSSVTAEDIDVELFKIERIRDILVRRESELRYMMDDIQLCKEITRLKKELQMIVSIPETEKSKEHRLREEELMQQIHKLVETRDFLVEDAEFERLREREEDREMATFLQSQLTKTLAKKSALQNRQVAPHSHAKPRPFLTQTGLTLLKDCCGLNCSVM